MLKRAFAALTGVSVAGPVAGTSLVETIQDSADKTISKVERLRSLRYSLQRCFLFEDRSPKSKHWKAMLQNFEELNRYSHLDIEIIQASKIDSVLRKILRMKEIPYEEEYHFRTQSQTLLDRWDARGAGGKVDRAIITPNDQPGPGDKSGAFSGQKRGRSTGDTPEAAKKQRRTWPSGLLRAWTKDELNEFTKSEDVLNKLPKPELLCVENASMYYECPSHKNCNNQPITGFDSTDIQLYEFNTNYGKGIRTRCQIAKDQAIREVTGKATLTYTNEYTIELKKLNSKRQKVYIDTENQLVGLINHSCEPNCRLEEWIVKGYIRLMLYAKRNILEEEELTFDYMATGKEFSKEGSECSCGSVSCRKPKFTKVDIAVKEKIGRTKPSASMDIGAKDEIKPLYCICREPDDGNGMVWCDEESCKHKWFHFACVGLIEPPSGEKWYCETCKNLMYFH